MIGLAGLIALLGYSLVYYGLDQIGGGNNSFFALIDPFKPFTSAPKDGGGGTSSSSSASINPATAPGFGNVAATATTPGLNFAPIPPVQQPTGGTSAKAPGGLQGR